MSSILDLLNSDLGKQVISGVSAQTGQPTDKTNNVLNMAMPVLLGAMKRNASSPQGAQGLMNALSNKHDGSILNNLGGLFAGGVDDDVQKDGDNILGHILGPKRPVMENAIGQQAGVDSSTVSQILKVAAPILMGMLGKQTREAGVNNPNAITGVLENFLGGSNPQTGNSSLLESILDADGDGSVIDDVAGMLLGGSKKKSGGLGGMLGGMLGGK
ncbi:DUF937 domain-containing protein [Gangjinia marincola]|uniref:DUF937 domain-containing protein n=1 Tax=Gangjinia marincola TaxID=578463 RepID=A0ABP3XP91_9FLAO